MIEIELPVMAKVPPKYLFPTIALSEIFGPEEWDDFLKTLREVERACGSNKNDRLVTLIVICIESGVDTMSNLIGVLRLLEYHPRHVAKIVKIWTGSNPDRHYWTRDSSGKYYLIR